MSKQSIEQLQQSINALQKQLDDLRNGMAEQERAKKVKIAPKVSMWEPTDIYYCILGTGICESASYTSYLDKERCEAGNCFPTRELAEYYAKRRAARQRLEMLALAENGMVPYEFQRRKDDLCNFYIGWYEDGNEVCVMDFAVINPGVQYFPTKQAAQRVLDAMTDDDLILLYGTANRGGK